MDLASRDYFSQHFTGKKIMHSEEKTAKIKN